MAFTHHSFPAAERKVPACMHPMDTLGDALLKYFLAAKLYCCIHPLCPRSLQRCAITHRLQLLARPHCHPPRLAAVAAIGVGDTQRHHRQLRAQPSENADYPGDESKVPPKPLADTCEALIGAVYLDSNLDLGATWHAVYPLLQPHVDHEIAAVAANSALYFF
ncbi:hypothetical protein HPB49_005673 [Dermacentor silvarum]|uniref:Uncharacterized protein n=1 Tax=Dermacentor silvarum TaxID=543639 RepID=A0ACB8C7D0_DERSI|nr:hypothetical protein HPB49_005673 [Dermacentor silvarum]